jgi:hypothetical protein
MKTVLSGSLKRRDTRVQTTTTFLQFICCATFRAATLRFLINDRHVIIEILKTSRLFPNFSFSKLVTKREQTTLIFAIINYRYQL